MTFEEWWESTPFGKSVTKTGFMNPLYDWSKAAWQTAVQEEREMDKEPSGHAKILIEENKLLIEDAKDWMHKYALAKDRIQELERNLEHYRIELLGLLDANKKYKADNIKMAYELEQLQKEAKK